MVKIRKVSCLDKFRLKKMISYLSDNVVEHYTKVLKNFPYMAFHDLLPLRLKFLPESFIMEDNNQILGMITVSKTHGNAFKININRLYLENDYYNVGKQLIDFVVAKYGAKGASSFNAIIDDSNEELLQLFAQGCGFRQCSSEQLWKLDNFNEEKINSTFFRPFRNTDAQKVCEMFNESIITHFKYTVSREKNEYYETLFRGLDDASVFKYIAENKDKSINAYFSIKILDNNFILTITPSLWSVCCYDDIIKFAAKEIKKRNKNFNLFVRVRKYLTSAESLEKYLIDKNARCVQNQIVLVKDFYRVIKNETPVQKVVLFNELSNKPVY